MIELIVSFRSFANAPKKTHKHFHVLLLTCLSKHLNKSFNLSVTSTPVKEAVDNSVKENKQEK